MIIDVDDAVLGMRRLRIKRKQLGLCTRCGRVREDSFTTCRKCRSEYRKRKNHKVSNNKIKLLRKLKKWKELITT